MTKNAEKPRVAKKAISPTRQEDYPQWYQSVVRAADMAEMSHVRGCMVIKPWGYGIWERIQLLLDAEIKATGHENAYFPIFIPLSYLEREAAHVEGFAKEMAVVTHHRLEQKGGRLVPTGELDEPLIVRPTSETIIGESFSRWIQSYRDLPLLVNQWANVVRWELRPRVFLRTTEFLWQEGHTAHETEAEAMDETHKMLNVYQQFVQDALAMPVIAGEKPAHERFPGAEQTFCIEAMMQDRKALQAGTSHFLGQNFAKAANIRFSGRSGKVEFVFTTSWGMSTRLIGALIMTHADDDGLRLPPRVAPKQVVIVPIVRDESDQSILEYANALSRELAACQAQGERIRAHVDRRDIRSIDKKWEWIRKGVPLILEVGRREMEAESVAVTRRDDLEARSTTVTRRQFIEQSGALLTDIQDSYFRQASEFRARNFVSNIETFEQLRAWFSEGDEAAGDRGGFVRAKWSGSPATVPILADMGVSIRCLPFDQSGTMGTCVVSGEPASVDAVFAKSY